MKQNFKRVILSVLIIFPALLLAQGTVSGSVTDEAGTPLPGVNVVIEGTQRGTTSDFDGNYNIDVSSFPAALVFSSLGYETKTMSVSSATVLNVVLAESATGLEEVVVTGLATSVKRSNLANTVATVSSDQLVGVAQPQTLDGALAGQFTGALVNANSGAPGGGLSVKLRGATSVFGNSQPLYIVDGVYVDNSSIPAGLNAVSAAAGGGSASNQDNPSNRIADLDPNDIENIEILKGASAAAIYGSRAAAGVIIITTKKGKEGKTRFAFQQSLGWTAAINLLGLREYNEESVEAAFGAAAVPDFQAAQSAGRLVDYEDELYGEKGLISNTNFSASGGNGKTSFYAGVNHKNEDGILKRSGYEKTSLRLNLEHKMFDRIRLNLNSNYINSSTDRGFFNNDNSGTTIGVSLTGTPPWVDLFPDENGNYPDNPNGSSNPLQTRDLITNNEAVNRVIMGGAADIDLYRNDNSSLKMILRGGLDSYNLVTTAIFPKELQFQKPENGGVEGVSIQGTATNTNYNLSAFLVHSYYTSSNINFRTQAGITREFFDQNRYLITARNLVASETNIDQAESQEVDQFRRKQEDSGFFVQEEVNFDDKLIGTIGVRGDKSSNNGDANQLYYYPKASLAGNLHNFDFWNSNSPVNRLKLRVAYGEAGNFPPFGSLFTSFTSTLIDGIGGISLDNVRGNPELGPERQKELEFGFDAGFLNDKIGIEFTYYIKKVDDLILQAAIEPSSGFVTEWVNAGNLENRGVEVAVNYTAFTSEDFNWNGTVNFWKNTSEITELNVPTFNLGAFGATLGTFRIEEGKSVTQIGGIGPNADANGFQVFGDAEPDFQMTFGNNLSYKDIELSFLIHWKQGGDNVNLSTLLTDLNGTSADYDDMTLDPSGTLSNGDYRLSQLGTSAAVFVEDASYLRLRQVGLYYNIPSQVMNRWFGEVISNIKFGFTGTNLVNIFDYNSYDPEVSNFGANGISTGVEVTPFPASKRYMFNLSVDF